MNKIVGIVGSLRKGSLNRTLFNEYMLLTKDKFEFIEGELKDIPLYNQDIETKPASVTNLSDIILSADAVIFFSPEYNYSVPGVLKNALDWVSRDERSPFSNKPAAIIGASPGNIGTARMQYHLRQIGVFLNIQFINKPEVMVGNALEKIKENKLVDESTKNFFVKHAEIFEKYIVNSHRG